MKTSRQVLITALVVFLIIISGSCQSRHGTPVPSDTQIFTNADGFSFALPDNWRDVTGNDLGEIVRSTNPSIMFVAIAELPDENALFSVSGYDMGETMTIDSAFMKSLNTKGTLSGEPLVNYRVIDHGIRSRDDKILRYKISFNPETKYSIIYYIMKNHASRFLYELKAVCESEAALTGLQESLEEVVMSSGFSER
ncbi:MAG: hypothetical protein IH591_03210 [Bacteroidales bacterium]|nr:hypothetical protein [Bacteroidales bacterium]